MNLMVRIESLGLRLTPQSLSLSLSSSTPATPKINEITKPSSGSSMPAFQPPTSAVKSNLDLGQTPKQTATELGEDSGISGPVGKELQGLRAIISQQTEQITALQKTVESLVTALSKK